MAKNYRILEDGGAAGVAASLTSIFDALFSLGKLALVCIVLVFAWYNHVLVGQYIEQWLRSSTHVSFLGISVDRQISANETIVKIATQRSTSDPNSTQINQYYARGAIIRASRNAPAISGARILWVDGHPENNALEASILSDMGIVIRRASNTKEALVLLPGFKPDLIISNVVRDGDELKALKTCPVHYFEAPPGVPDDLSKLNADINAGVGKATGFSLAEAISRVDQEYTDHIHPRIIFYSASSGGIVADQCARTITNRVDVLLNGVVSALEEIHWQKLQDLSQSQQP